MAGPCSFFTLHEGVMFSDRFRWACVTWLFVSMGWGALLRWSGVSVVDGLNYRFALHTHSHLALLGWVVMGFYVLLGERFFASKRKKAARTLFWFLQASLLGMLLSFPLQGYGSVSIVSSTLFVFGTYAFSWWLYRDCRDECPEVRQLVRSAAVFIAVSSIGPYVVGYLKAKGLEATPEYSNALYFYLHFLYNGFFVSAMLALVFSAVEVRVLRSLPRFEISLFLFGLSLSYFLSVLWTGPHPVYYSLGAAGGALQLIILVRWLWALELVRGAIGSGVLRVVLGLLAVKMGMQLVSAHPEVAAWLFVSQIYTIIGYIHFVMLGIVTPFLLVSFFPEISQSGWARTAWVFYGVGFLVTEGLLFGAGLWIELRTAIPYTEVLFSGYVLLVLGAAWATFAIRVRHSDATCPRR